LLKEGQVYFINKEAGMISLTGKVALVTGGAAGIGRGTAIEFANMDAKVVICDMNRAGGEDTVRMIQEKGKEALFIRTDVSIASEVEALVKGAVDRFGRLDAAFNCAGVGLIEGRIADSTEQNYDFIFNVNVRGLWLSMKYEIQQMLKQGQGGAIVNCSSIQGLVAMPGTGHYTAAKHAVEGYTKLAALDYAADGIRVNSVCPGVIESGLGGDLLQGEARRMFLALHPLGFFGLPSDVANLVVFLASDAARNITGTSVRTDGGYCTR
jgi:NAD(P)-dependent dehydrogenase (short-subunit alcohol dehydrogenase family)